MWTASLLQLLLLLAASCFAQDETRPSQQEQTPLGDDTCSLQAATITCNCRPGREVLSLTASYMEGGGVAEALEVSGCSSATFAFPPLQRLHTLLVRHTARATFQEKASPLLRHLALVNVSQLALQGPVFKDSGLETVFFDGVRVSTLPSGAFSGLSKIQNVTFRDVEFNEVEQGAVDFQMVNNSELTILKSKLLGIQKSGFVVKGVTNFTMHKSMVTTVGVDGLQLDSTGPISIEESHLQPAGRIKLAVMPGASFRFVNNIWQNSSVFDVAQELLFSGALPEVMGNTFPCSCDPALNGLIGLPAFASLLDNNQCDEGLCGRPVPMRILTSCQNQTVLAAACAAPLPAEATTTTPGKTSTLSSVTVPPRAATASSRGTNNTAATIAISLTTALLLSVPAATALAL